MASTFAFTMTRWALKLASRMIQAKVRVHNLEVIEKDMSILFVVNHFTRLETLLIPYEINIRTGLQVWSLAAAELFVGRMGQYLRSMGTVSTQDPDRDKVIINSLLRGDNPWLIFPEGQMIKDKKVIDAPGVYSVYNRGKRRPPHRGAAVLALLTEYYRHRLRQQQECGDSEQLDALKTQFELDDLDPVLNKRTVIVPINITYFPIRARENFMLRMAASFARGEMSPRAIEELSVEGTFLSSDTTIDITLGEPIDIDAYLNRPDFRPLLDCAHEELLSSHDPESVFTQAADRLTRRYMESIYQLTRINYDHIFATIIRFQGTKPFTERRYRNRIYLVAHELNRRPHYHLNDDLKETYRQIIFEDPSEEFHNFMELCIKEKIIRRDGRYYVRIPGVKRGHSDFHTVRTEEPTYVIANEVEPLDVFFDLVKEITSLSRKELSQRVRKLFFEEDQRIFEEDYQEFKSEQSHPRDIGRPFLISPEKPRAGIVLVHGYLAAPEEVRGLAEYLRDQGYAVYGVRLKGHGTSPEDLAQVRWEDWYTSFNRGYVVIKSLTDKVILGGFSTGGLVALMGAGFKRDKVQAVFSINAPRRLRQYSARFASTVMSMNSLLRRFKRGRESWDYVANNPENPHINYKRNPVAGVVQLDAIMKATDQHLPNIVAPTLIVQASKDPVVHSDSGAELFSRVGTPYKELLVVERDRHGIINGDGAEDIFERVNHFLNWASRHAPEPQMPEPAFHGDVPKPMLEQSVEETSEQTA